MTMRFAPRLLLSTLSLALLASAAPAQRLKLSDKDSRQVMADFARCVVKERAPLASRAVVEDWDSERIIAEGGKLLPPTCVNAAGLIDALRFPAPTIRAGLAEQFLLADPAIALTADSVAAAVPLAYRQPWPIATVDKKGRPLKAEAIERQSAAVAEKQMLIRGQQVGECVVRANPAAVRAIFATEIAGSAEIEAFKLLAPVLPKCVPARTQMAFSRNSLRAALALSYYRMAMAARGIAWMGEAPRPAGAN